MPAHVGNASWNYNPSTKILTANIIGVNILNVNWQTGATVRLLDPFFDNGGIMIGRQHTFRVIIYSEDVTDDIKYVHLELATGTNYAVTLRYNGTDRTFSNESDPNNIYTLNQTACSSTIENNTYLNLNFVGTFNYSTYPASALNQYEDTNVKLESNLYGNLSNLQARTYYAFNRTLWAMKTSNDSSSSRFYVPNATFVNTSFFKIEMLFNDSNLWGDKKGPSSQYTNVSYPDGKVNMFDTGYVASMFGKNEGDPGWDYMGDLVPDRKINMFDISRVASNFGKSGNYSYNLAGVFVSFDTGQVIKPDADGFAQIPPGAKTFWVTQNGMGIGAMIIFCGP
jgi:hypothetical protein